MTQKLSALLLSWFMGIMVLSTYVPLQAEAAFVLDVNGFLDGVSCQSLEGYATVDVYLDGVLVADDVSDYRQPVPMGTQYRIMDITTSFFKSFNGYHLGACQGTIEDADCLLELDFTTIDVSVKGEGTKLEVFNDHTYLMFEREETWYSANEICNALGGHLVSINSKAENDYIANFTDFDIWTGGTDRDKEGVWTWTSKEQFVDYGFSAGEPNNIDNNDELEENYLETFHGVWNDSHGNFKKPFVCEFDSITNPYDFHGYLTNAMEWKNLEAWDGKLRISPEVDTYYPRGIWHFKMQEDGYFTIYNCYDDKVLTADIDKQTVSLEEDKNLDTQAWWIDLFPYANLHPKGSDLVLNVVENNHVTIANFNDSDRQGFTIYDIARNAISYNKPNKPIAPILSANKTYTPDEDITLHWSTSPQTGELDKRTYAIRICDDENKTDLFFNDIEEEMINIGKLSPNTYIATVWAINCLYEGWRTESNTISFTVTPRHLVFIDDFWYEDGVLQGNYGDPKNITDTIYGFERGREIFDPTSNGWYWLDAVFGGKRAKNKEVWMPYIYQNEDSWDDAEIRMNANHADPGMEEFTFQCMKKKSGKWVRYDENGKMFKGWVHIEGDLAQIYPKQAGNTYYYDHMTGLMAKGTIVIDGETHVFDDMTGVLIH